jgi:hypothetical protein
MGRPRLLDLYCGQGGAAAGYQTAGFDVTGVDIADHSTRYPGTFIHGDALAYLAQHGHEYDAIHASPPCFAAGTPVLTRRGSVPIEEVIVGDEVWTHRNRWRPVTDTMTRESELVRVGPITTTPDHRFYSRPQRYAYDSTARRRTWGLGPADWTPAEQLRGHFVSSPLAVQTPGEWCCDPWLAGRYVADGWTGRDGIMIAVGSGKAEEFEQQAGTDWRVAATGKSCERYTRQDVELAAWLRSEFGHGAANKSIPTWVLGCDEAERARFLEGYLSGDGTVRPNGWTANTVSTQLASQLRLLALSLGYNANVREVVTSDTVVIEGRTVNQRNYWSVGITTGRGRYTRDVDGLHWFKQRKPVAYAGFGRVYDITVAEDHSFVAFGYVVHNCQGYSIATAGNPDARAKHKRLIAATRELLALTGRPWVIENVEQARSQMVAPVLLCGRSFGLAAADEDGTRLVLDRHRLFESNIDLAVPDHAPHDRALQVAGVYGGSRRAKRLAGETLAQVAPRDRYAARVERGGGYVPRSIAVQQALLGIDWMTVKGMQESIPPVYAEHVGRQLLAHLDRALAPASPEGGEQRG